MKSVTMAKEQIIANVGNEIMNSTVESVIFTACMYNLMNHLSRKGSTSTRVWIH